MEKISESQNIDELLENLIKSLKNKDNEAVDLYASALFIDKYGSADYPNIVKFEKMGKPKEYQVIPLERDSFGWVVGGIKYRGDIYPFG